MSHRKSAVTVNRVYTPATNEMLQDLCGPNHRYLQMLESKLDAYNLRVESQGGGISLSGKEVGVSIAETALAELEKRISKGTAMSVLEVEGAIEAASAPDGAFDSALKGLKKPITAKTRGQASYLSRLSDPKAGLVFGTGPAGTGKTYLAVAAGVSELLSGARERLIVTRPAIEAGEKLGFLPGTLEEKVDPYMLPIWDALREFMGQE